MFETLSKQALKIHRLKFLHRKSGLPSTRWSWNYTESRILRQRKRLKTVDKILWTVLKMMNMHRNPSSMSNLDPEFWLIVRVCRIRPIAVGRNLIEPIWELNMFKYLRPTTCFETQHWWRLQYIIKIEWELQQLWHVNINIYTIPKNYATEKGSPVTCMTTPYTGH